MTILMAGILFLKTLILLNISNHKIIFSNYSVRLALVTNNILFQLLTLNNQRETESTVFQTEVDTIRDDEN